MTGQTADQGKNTGTEEGVVRNSHGPRNDAEKSGFEEGTEGWSGPPMDRQGPPKDAETSEAVRTVPPSKRGTGPTPTADIPTVREWAENPALLEEPEKLTSLLGRRGHLESLFGKAKSGKSTLLSQMACEAAKGGLKCVWCSYEGEPLSLMVQRFLRHEGGGRVYLPAWGDLPRNWREWWTFVEKAEADLILIDSISAIIGRLEQGDIPSEGAGSEWQYLFDLVKKPIIDTPTGIVILDHMGHSGENARGSSGKEAAPDTLYRFKKGQGTKRILKEEGRWGIKPLIRLKFDLATDMYSVEHANKAIEKAVRAFLKKNPGASQRDCRDNITGGNEEIAAAYNKISGKEED